VPVRGIDSCPGKGIPGRVAFERRYSSEVRNPTARVHPLDDLLVGLPLHPLVELEVTLHEPEARVRQLVRRALQ
jgi:hypothetical protein